MAKLTREEVEKIVREARDKGEWANLDAGNVPVNVITTFALFE